MALHKAAITISPVGLLYSLLKMTLHTPNIFICRELWVVLFIGQNLTEESIA